MDIVDRLRKRREFGRNGATWIMLTLPDGDCTWAANEIERLRAAIRKYLSHQVSHQESYRMFREVIDEPLGETREG